MLLRPTPCSTSARCARRSSARCTPCSTCSGPTFSMRVEEIRILAAEVLAPPPDLTVSEWADQNRRLSSESAAEKGEWRTDRAPYQRAVMDAMGLSSPYETVVMMWAAQSGKSSMLENFLGYIIELDPGPALPCARSATACWTKWTDIRRARAV